MNADDQNPEPLAADDDDDMFEPGTEANHEALELLRELLLDVGFRVNRKARKEATLRVYLEGRDSPLLNPRFEPSGDAFGAPQHDESIVFAAWANEDASDLGRRLEELSAGAGFTFVRDGSSSTAARAPLGWFVVPMSFEEDDDEVRFDVAALERSLRELHEVLGKVAPTASA
jgi:hypothetical protein